MEELELVKKIIRKTGAMLLDFYNNGAKVSEKEDGHLVTEADLAAEKLILDELRHFDYGIVSEETSEQNDRFNKEKVWIIDPLDGTKDFVEKTGDFSPMIALIDKGQPVLGAVYQPTTDKLYYATKGQGAFLQEKGNEPKKLMVSNKDIFSDMTLLVSRHHLREIEINLSKELGIVNMGKHGGAGLKSCLIAEQLGEIYMNASNKTGEWDICAADIIVHEAGGKVTDIHGNPLIYNKKDPHNHFGFLVTNGKKHEQIVETLNVV